MQSSSLEQCLALIQGDISSWDTIHKLAVLISYERQQALLFYTPAVMQVFFSVSNAVPSAGRWEKCPRVIKVLQVHGHMQYGAPCDPGLSIWTGRPVQAHVPLKVMAAPLAGYEGPAVWRETETPENYLLPFKWKMIACCFCRGNTSI